MKSRWPRTQVLVITGLQDPTVAAGALSAGADRYLFKPFGMPELRRHLVDGLKRRDRMIRVGSGPDAATSGAEEVRAEIGAGVEHLIHALLGRHPFLVGHAERVSAFALRLAGELDGPVDPEGLAWACRLCDLGNLSVPSALLAKAGSLDGDEVACVRTHPAVGRQILEHLVGEGEVLGVVTWHHERWDGGGYPDGLAGGTIPLAARIVSVADALAAMTSVRPFRPARPWQEAVAEIDGQAGIQFDPAVVDAMHSCLPDLSDIFIAFANEDDATE